MALLGSLGDFGVDGIPSAAVFGSIAMNGDEYVRCNRCGYGGCDVRVASCGCTLHAVSLYHSFYTNSYVQCLYQFLRTIRGCAISANQRQLRIYVHTSLRALPSRSRHDDVLAVCVSFSVCFNKNSFLCSSCRLFCCIRRDARP